jgi:hypothetical protein
MAGGESLRPLLLVQAARKSAQLRAQAFHLAAALLPVKQFAQSRIKKQQHGFRFSKEPRFKLPLRKTKLLEAAD